MKNYMSEMVDLRGDGYLNPGWPGHSRPLGSITSIAVHHDAAERPHAYDSVARYRNEAAAHYERLGPGLQYHFKIDNAGGIFWIRPLELYLYAVGSSANLTTINICVDGYFHAPYNQKPTREQYEALSQLIIWLGTEHPQFPAGIGDTYDHSYFSATACCGDTLRPYVQQIVDEATARNIPADAVYDWPELQPSAPAPTPPPAPVDTRPDYDKNYHDAPRTMWTEGTATVIDLKTNTTIATVADNTKMDIGGSTQLGGTTFMITAYWTSRGVHYKAIPAAQLKDSPDVIPVPTPPVNVPVDEQQAEPVPTTVDRSVVILFLESIVKQIAAFIAKLKGEKNV